MRPTPFHVYLDLERHRGICEFGKVCRGQDMLQAMEVMFQSPDWDRGFDSLWDFSGVKSLDLQLVQVESMLAQSRDLTAIGQSGRLAAVVIMDDHVVIAKLLSVRLEKSGRDAQVFRTRQDAEAWLGAERQAAPTT